MRKLLDTLIEVLSGRKTYLALVVAGASLLGIVLTDSEALKVVEGFSILAAAGGRYLAARKQESLEEDRAKLAQKVMMED